MAKKKERISPNVKKNLLKLMALDDNISSAIHGTSKKLDSEVLQDTNKVKDLVLNIKRKFNKNLNDNDTITFWNSINSIKANSIGKRSKSDKKYINIADIIEKELTDGLISAAIVNTTQRRALYENYELVYKLIPFLGKAVDVIRDNIISPDDFSKKVISFKYTDPAGFTGIGASSPGNDEYKRIVSNIDTLVKDHKLEVLLPEVILQSLKLGDQFWHIVKINERIDAYVQEDSEAGLNESLFDYENGTYITESDIEIPAELFESMSSVEVDLLVEELPIFSTYIVQDKKTKKMNIDLDAFKVDMAKIINDKIETITDSSAHYNSKIDEFKKDYIDSSSQNLNFKNDINDPAKSKTPIKVTGGFIERINPENVIVIEKNDFIYGYYIIEGLRPDEPGLMSDMGTFGHSSVQTSMSAGRNVTSTYSSSILRDTRPRTISEKIFVNTIVDRLTDVLGKKLNRKTINKNAEFKNIIYAVLKNNYNRVDNIKIIYVPESRMVHFKRGDDVYGQSVYAGLLFIAKVYLAILMNKFINKVLRSSDRRAFYIEVGLDEDIESVVQSFIRDLRTKDFKMSNFNNINNIISQPGYFADYMIPKIDGASPIEIDTIQGMQEDVSGDDFIDFLEKKLVSGCNVPSAFLNIALDEMEFARTISMQNGLFVRFIASEQRGITPPINKAMRILYKLSFECDSNVLDNISCVLPPPSFLNMSIIGEHLSAVTEVIDKIVEIVAKEDEPEPIKKSLKYSLTTEMMPSVDWKHINELLSKCRSDFEANPDVKSDDDSAEEEEYGLD